MRHPITARFKAILQSNALINGVVLSAICVGFFHGWLKIHIRHPAITFLFDALLGLALLLVYSRKEPEERFFPGSAIGKALLLFYVLCFVYLFIPGAPPLLVALAALRGWCFASLIYCLGYHLTHSVAQVKGYFYVLILLGVLTAIYGIQQTPEKVQKMVIKDKQIAERYKGIYYADKSGKLELRRFSTFVSSGVFGGVMAYVIIFAVALLSDKESSARERILLVAAILPISYGLVLSGARSALIMMGVGFATIAWQRRRLQTLVLLPAIIFLGIHFGVTKTGGKAVERYGTLLETQTIADRLYYPTWIGWQSIKENPLGNGLGKSGYSVPFFLSGKLGYKDFKTADGDLGCLMIEMGIPGVIVFCWLLWTILKALFNDLNQLKDTPLASIALACAGCIVIAIVIFPIGSPFLGIPTGALTWFFLGTLEKLTRQSASQVPMQPKVSPEKRFLYYHPEQ
ncbi:MAG: hypothetical protein SFY81_12240 [Verrucomicrobiota bacterium]|nr:hypothetical protein [Verrucomicrobiota bacterium]